MLKKNRGESKIILIVILLIVVAGIYVGFKWGYASWDAAGLREDVNASLVYWSTHGAPPPENMRIEILQKARENNIELYDEDINIELSDQFLNVNLYWETALAFPGGYTYYLPFSIEREVRIN